MLHAICLAAYIAAQSADVGTSLALPAPRYYEVHRFAPSSPAGLVTFKATLGTATAIAGWKMRKQHPKLAVVVFVAGAVTGTYAAVHNARLLAQRRHP